MNTTPISSTYNSNNNIISQEQGNQTYTYKYENENNPHLVTSVTQDGITMTFGYNTAGALTSNKITAISGSAYLYSSTSYDPDRNHASRIEDVNGIYTNYNYTNGLLNYVKNANNTQTNYTYYSGNDRQKTAYIYNLVEVNYAYTKGALTQIVRDAGQNSTADSLTYTFVYDDYGNTTEIKVGTYTLVTYEYEPYNGKLIKTTYGTGMYVKNVYDELDRIIAIKVGGEDIDETTKYTYAYNGNGDLYEVKDIDNNITLCYNYYSLGRLLSSWQKIGDSVNSYTYYSYDDMGRACQSNCYLDKNTITLYNCNITKNHR